MMDFFVALFSQTIFCYALCAGFFASVVAGVIGTLINLKNVATISGGIAHAILGGIGIAYFFGLSEIGGALVFALVVALLISWIHFYFRENENVVITALWALGMALGLIFMYLTPGYSTDLTTYIFGSLVFLTQAEVVLIGVLAGGLVLIVGLFYRQFVALIFDPEQAELRGLRTKLIYTLLIGLIALSVVILLKITGLILLLALLTLPAAVSRMFSKNIPRIMLLAAVLCFGTVLLGFCLAYFFELPTGAVIVLTLGLVYFGALLLRGC